VGEATGLLAGVGTVTVVPVAELMPGVVAGTDGVASVVLLAALSVAFPVVAVVPFCDASKMIMVMFVTLL